MLIQCLLKRAEPVIVPIGNEKYAFEPDDQGRNVCEVWLENHISAFLAVSHLYRKADAPAAEPEAPSGKPIKAPMQDKARTTTPARAPTAA